MTRLRLLLAAPLLALAAAAPASAATYCVADPACPADGIAEPDVPAAVAAATPGFTPDLIRVGPGRFPLGTGIDVVAGDVLTGAGSGQTTLVGAIDMDTSAAGALRGVTVEMTRGQRAGVSVRRAQLTDVVVDGTDTVDPDAVGIDLADGGRVVGGGAVMTAGTGILSGGSGVTIADATIEAPLGIDVSYYGSNVKRTQITATTGIRLTDGRLTLDAVAVRLTGFRPTGVAIGWPVVDYKATVTASHLTVDGADRPGSTGVSVASKCDQGGVYTTLDASVFVRLATAISRIGCDGPAADPAVLTVTRSAFDPSSVVSAGAGSASIEAPVTPDPVLAADLVPPAGSPLVDAGDPAEAAGLDVRGLTRPADGDGNGSAVADVGAFELQPAPAAPAPGAGSPAAPGPAAGAQPPAGGVAGQSQTSKRRTAGRPVVRVTRSKRHPRRFTVRVSVAAPRGASARGGAIVLDAWTVKRHLGVLRAKADRSGRATLVFRLPRGVKRAKVGIQAQFGGTATLKPRAGDFVGLY